jgi:hypothetical protein
MLVSSAILAQTVTTTKLEDKKPGDPVSISGSNLKQFTSVTLQSTEGKPEIPPDNLKIEDAGITFNMPAAASGKYLVKLGPGDKSTSIPLTVTPAGGAPSPADPVIESVYPTTTYPVQGLFNFEINGQHFDPDPNNDQVEVQGQGRIHFGKRHPGPGGEAPGQATECKKEPVGNYPCLEASPDGNRLKVWGYPRRSAYQGSLSVRVIVQIKDKELSSKFSDPFTMSRVDYRIIVFLAFALFGLLMYVVYQLVSKGVRGYTVAGRKYSPLAAFVMDKSTDTYSLSKFQLFALSMVAFFGYVYVFLCRALVQWNFAFPEIPDNYPTLLAISAGTTAAAAGLTGARGTKGAGPVYPGPADFISDGGLVVAERFQFFVWTLIACIGFIGLLLMQNPATVNSFPTFPNGLLYVMGVSAAGYLGGKAVRPPGPILKQVQVDVQMQSPLGGHMPDLNVTLKGENLDKKAKFRIDGALQEPIGKVNGTPQSQGPQDYCADLTFTLSQAGGFAKGDHTFEITNDDGVGAQKIFTAEPMRATETGRVPHGTARADVHLIVENLRPDLSARWLPPFAKESLDISAADVKRGAANEVIVTLVPGAKLGTGTLTLVAPLGGTEAISVTVADGS